MQVWSYGRYTGLISFVSQFLTTFFFIQRMACSSACSFRVMKKNKIVVEALSSSIFVPLFFLRNGCKKTHNAPSFAKLPG